MALGLVFWVLRVREKGRVCGRNCGACRASFLQRQQGLGFVSSGKTSTKVLEKRLYVDELADRSTDS